MKRIILMSLATVFLVGCQDRSFLTGTPESPDMRISDGTLGGNPDFFFLPPMLPNPIGNEFFEPDNSDPNLEPDVRICADRTGVDGDGNCLGVELVSFLLVPFDVSHYHVDWLTDQFDLTADTYRIHVLLDGISVGFADVDVVDNGKQFKNVNGDDIGLKDGRTLPIKFRLEAGIRCFLFVLANPGTECAAQFIDFNVGGQVTLPSGTNIFIPPQQTPPPSTVTVQDCVDGVGDPEDLPLDLALFGGCIEILADPPLPGTGLTEDAIVSLCEADFSSLSDAQEGLVTLHKLDGAAVTALPHAAAICPVVDASVSSNPLVRFARAGWNAIRGVVSPEPLYAVRRRGDEGAGGEAGEFSRFQFALPAKIEKIDGDNQTALVGTDVLIPPAVKVTDRDNNPVAGATVTFEVITNAGTVVPLTRTTAALVGNPAVDGIVTVDSWTLGSAVGLNELKAAGRGFAVAPADPHQPTLAAPDVAVPVPLDGNVVFTATGFAEVVLDFEGLADRAAVTNQFAGLGVTFTGAEILTKDVSLSALFPPNSGDKVIFDFPEMFNGLITVDFTVQVFRAGGFVTGNRVITLSCFDASNVLLGSSSTAAANFVGAGTGVDPNVFLEVSSAGIAKCTFQDDGNTYTVDDFTFAHTGS